MAAADEEYIREECLNNDEMRKIFVTGIPSDAEDGAFKSFFEEICGGTVTHSSIVRKEGQSEKKNLIAFVTFETSELVDEVLLKRGSLSFNGKELEVNRAVPKTIQWVGAREKVKKLFIANLPKDTKEDDLMKYLKARHPSKYGTIESIQLIKEKNPADGSRTEVNKGYGFIFVSSEDMADKMSIQHANFTFGGRKIELKKNVVGGGGEGGRGGGRGGGGDKGMRGGRGGGQFQGNGGYDGGYGGQWGADQYGAGGYGAGGYGAGGYGAGGYGAGGYGAGGYGAGGYGAGGYGAGGYGAGGYGGGYGGGPAAAAGGGGRGRGRGGNRFQPY